MADTPPDLSAALSIEGRVVLVTGGGAGVGRGISERFLAAGAMVAICGRHEPEALPASGGRSATFHTADVRDAEQVASLIDEVMARHGRLDVAVNNAGGSPPADSATASAKFSTAIVALNLLGPLFVAQRAYAVMTDGGSIINIGSVSGMRPTPTTAAYGAAKAGLVNLTQTLAMEWAPKVRVNMVTVGVVRTEKAHLFYGDEAGLAAVDATVPVGRMATPADVGDACLLLASPLARYITGANLAVHGGGERPPYLGASTA
jgi:NAD(P)-dependent dehydrogenase (short-subunit alcohol dehydrogenase family)